MTPVNSVAQFALVVLLVLVACAAGFLLGRLRESRALAGERLIVADLRGQLQASTSQAQVRSDLAEQQVQLLERLAPIAESVTQLGAQVARSERDRAATDAQLRQQLADGQRVHLESAAQMQAEARKLGRALSRSHMRGAWGEAELRRLVEASGMLERVHFDVQRTVGDAGARPDMLVHLAGGGEIVVDAKAPLDALLAAPEDEDTFRPETLQQHAKALKDHVDALAKREYSSAADGPELVVLFLPAESLLSLALSGDAGLLDHAFSRGVALATPTTLLSLLRTASVAWRQDALARNAREVHDLALELHRRLATMSAHFRAVGKGLDDAVAAYNRTVGSYESRVLVQARRFTELGVAGDELPGTPAVEAATRPMAIDLTERAG